MIKPVPKQRKSVLNFREMRDFVEKKYNIDIRDYGGTFKNGKIDESKPFQDYWGWLFENYFHYELHNGSDVILDLVGIIQGDNPEWVKEITKLFHNEFKDHLIVGEIKVHMDW